MPLSNRREIVLTVEREARGRDGIMRRVGFSARYDLSARPQPVSPAELGEEVNVLDRQLEEALRGAGFTVRPDRVERDLTELVETYRPRQADLIEALEADGELSNREAALLREHLALGPAAAPARAGPPPIRRVAEPPVTDRPLAAMPLANDRAPSVPRPVAELLSTYRIESVKQAGAVRARRQISFDEYMSLKRHFAEQGTEGGSGGAAANPSR